MEINGEVAIDAVPDGTPDAVPGGDGHIGGGGIGGTPKGRTNGGEMPKTGRIMLVAKDLNLTSAHLLWNTFF